MAACVISLVFIMCLVSVLLLWKIQKKNKGVLHVLIHIISLTIIAIIQAIKRLEVITSYNDIRLWIHFNHIFQK